MYRQEVQLLLRKPVVSGIAIVIMLTMAIPDMARNENFKGEILGMGSLRA